MSNYYDEPTPTSDPLSNPRVITAIVLAVAALVAIIGCIGLYFFVGGGNRGGTGQGTLVVNVTGIPTLTPTLTPIPSDTLEPTLEEGTGGGGEGEATPDLTLTFAALPAIRTANLSDLRGLVQIRTSPDGGFTTITENVAIQEDTAVLTSENSSAKMTTTEGSVNRVSSQTQYSLTDFSGTATNPVTKLTLDFGKVWSVVDNPLGTGKFEVDTPLGLASMLEPSYMSVEYNSTEEVAIITCLFGRCRFANDSGVQDLVTGQQLIVRKGVPLSSTSPTPIDSGQLLDWATQMPTETGRLTPTATITPSPTATRTPTVTRTPRDTPNVEQTSNAAGTKTAAAATQAQSSQNQTATQNSANLTSTVFFFNVTATALFQSTMNSFTATSFSFTATSFGATSAANATNSSFTQTASVNQTNASIATATWVSTIATATAAAAQATGSAIAQTATQAAVPIINFDPASYATAAPESSGQVTLTVRIANAVPVNVDMTASLTGVSIGGAPAATGGSPISTTVDFDNTTINFFIPANQLTTTIVVPIADDGAAEPNETFQVTIACSPGPGCNGGAQLGPNTTSSVTIVNSPRPTVGFSSGGFSATEGDSGTSNAVLTVNLSRAYANVNTVTASYTILGSGTATGTADCNDTADPAKDYDNNSITDDDSTPADGILTFAVLETSRTITIPICGDTPDEPNETVDLTLAVTSGNASLGTGTTSLTILDNDVAPAITISPASASATEPAAFGTATVSFDVNLSAQSGQTITVNYATVPGSASQGTDYQGASGVLTFTPGDTLETINITLFGDQLHESDETFSVSLSSPVNATLGTPSSSVFTINDDGDAAPAVFYSAVPYEMFEGNTGTTNIQITVNLSRLSGQQIVLVYSTADGGGTGDCTGIASANAGSDYNATSGTITYTAGVDLSKQFTVTVNGDTTNEPTECLRLSLTVGAGDYNAGSSILNSALVIKNDDP